MVCADDPLGERAKLERIFVFPFRCDFIARNHLLQAGITNGRPGLNFCREVDEPILKFGHPETFAKIFNLDRAAILTADQLG